MLGADVVMMKNILPLSISQNQANVVFTFTSLLLLLFFF
jgi:hypothetical protein